MIHWVNEIDKELFLFLNGIHNGFFDFLMVWITNKFTWFPFYLLIIFVLVYKFRTRGLIIVLMVGLVILLSDQFTTSFMKPYFERLRPCHDPEISGLTHMVSDCGGLYGFTSSHACNSFGLIMSLFLIFRRKYPWIGYLFIWAAIVSYSRVYVGVHYPGDLLAGALIGIGIAIFIYFIYIKLPSKYKLDLS